MYQSVLDTHIRKRIAKHDATRAAIGRQDPPLSDSIYRRYGMYGGIFEYIIDSSLILQRRKKE